MNDRIFKAKVSYSILIFIFVVLFGPLVFYIDSFFEDTQGLLVLLAFLMFLFGMIVYLFFGTKYQIKGNNLVVLCGWFEYIKLPIEKIREVKKSRSIISAPAPSLDRIAVVYGSGSEVLISPDDVQGLIKELKGINTSIVVGDL